MVDLTEDLLPLDRRVNEGRRTSFGEAVGAAFENTPTTMTGSITEREMLEPFHGTLTADPTTGGRLYRDGDGNEVRLSDDMQRRLADDAVSDDMIEQLYREIEAGGATPPMPIAEWQERRAAILERERTAYEENASIIARTNNPFAAQLVGGIGSGFTDPVNLATIPIGAPARLGLMGTVALEAALNSAIEGLSTPSRNEYLRSISQEEESVLTNMLVGAAFGGVVGGGVKGGQMAFDAVTADAGREFSAEMERILDELPDETAAAVQDTFSRLQRSMDDPAVRLEVANTLSRSEDPEVALFAEAVARDAEDALAGNQRRDPDADREHATRAQRGYEAAVGGQPVDLPDRPVEAIPRGSIINGEVREFAPEEMQLDPGRFQFKTSDEQGLTGKLDDVPVWRSERAGVLLGFEDMDGNVFVADGHQRFGLASRIRSQDPSQDIKLAVRVFREEDGYTPEQVKIIAAHKNIAEAADGMTNALARDAAKILRMDPEAVRELPRGPGIERAQHLSRLGDDAFQLVINDVVPDRFAAIVGATTSDPKLQMAYMRLLERTSPATTQQAAAIIAQARNAPVTREVTEDLFGTQEIAESLYLERAKVLERAMRTLRQDRATFRTLTERAAEIGKTGDNKLDDLTNKQIRELLEEALYAIDKLAYRAGPISEALDDGARQYKETGRLKDASAAVVSAIRNELERNGLARATAGDGKRASKPPSESGAALDPFEGFDNPVDGDGAKAQVANTRIEPERVDSTAEGRAVAAEVAQAIQPTWEPYMIVSEGAELIPVASIVSEKMRPQGVRNAVPFMQKAAAGEVDKRPAIALKDNGDGTYSVRDGNSTFAIAEAAGWKEIPGAVLTDQEFRTEQARKAVSRIFDTKLGKTKKRLVMAEDLPAAEVITLEAELKKRQPGETLDELLQSAGEHHASLQEAMKEITDDIGLRDYWKPAPIKAAETAAAKVKNKYNGDHRKITDVARAGVTVRSVEDIEKVRAALAKRYHIVDEGMKITPQGYFDQKFIVVFDDGLMGEVQLWPPGMLEAKSERGGHEAYEVFRDPTQPEDARAEADRFMRELYGGVQASLDASFAAKLGKETPSSVSSAAASVAESSTARSSDRTAAANASEGSDQPPSSSSSSTPTDRSSDSAPTSEPSKVKTRMGVTSDTNIVIPGRGVEETPAGTQTLIEGVAPITARERVQAAADKPLMAPTRTTDSEIGGLFDPDDPVRNDLFDRVPVGVEEVDGEKVTRTVSREDLAKELDEDDAFAEALGVCMK